MSLAQQIEKYAAKQNYLMKNEIDFYENPVSVYEIGDVLIKSNVEVDLEDLRCFCNLMFYKCNTADLDCDNITELFKKAFSSNQAETVELLVNDPIKLFKQLCEEVESEDKDFSDALFN